MTVYGYIYSRSENLLAQEKMLKDCRFDISEVFVDNNVSKEIPALGRPSLSNLVKTVKKGDVCVFVHIGCLGFSTMDILITAEKFEGKNIPVNVLQMDGLDVTSEIGGYALTLLATAREWERSAINFD